MIYLKYLNFLFDYYIVLVLNSEAITKIFNKISIGLVEDYKNIYFSETL